MRSASGASARARPPRSARRRVRPCPPARALVREQVGTQAVERASIVAARHAALQRIEQRADLVRAAGVLVQRGRARPRGPANVRRATRAATARARPVALREQRVGKLQLRVRAVRLHRECRPCGTLSSCGRPAAAAARLARAAQNCAVRARPTICRAGRSTASRHARTTCALRRAAFAQAQQARRPPASSPARARVEQRIGARSPRASGCAAARCSRDCVRAGAARRAGDPVPRRGRRSGIVRHEHEIRMQCIEIRGIAAGRLQHAPPQRHRLRMVGVGALRERPGDPVRLRPRVGIAGSGAARAPSSRSCPADRPRPRGAARRSPARVRPAHSTRSNTRRRAHPARRSETARRSAGPLRPRGCARAGGSSISPRPLVATRYSSATRRVAARSATAPASARATPARLSRRRAATARALVRPAARDRPARSAAFAQRVARGSSRCDAPHPRGVEQTLRIGGRGSRRRCGFASGACAAVPGAAARDDASHANPATCGAARAAAHERPPSGVERAVRAPNR